MQTTILIWICFMSLWAFAAMGYDKSQAKRKGQRISEKSLWTLAVFGGGVGAYLGMQIFRHKTLHTGFRIGFLMLAIAYVIGVLYLLGVIKPGVIVA